MTASVATNQTLLVVGGGIAGMTAALEAAECGKQVILVEKLPTIGGGTPKPLFGAQGFFLSSFSENKLVAQSFLLDYIATAETMGALYTADPRNPAFVAAFDAISSDTVAASGLPPHAL